MRWKKRNIGLLFILFSYFLMSNLIPSNIATADDYKAPYRAGAGPVIDGTIAAAEWINATQGDITFQFNDSGITTLKVKLFLLHNATALFIGLNITQEDNSIEDAGDAFIVYFDKNHNEVLDGSNSKPNEEGVKLQRNNVSTDISYNGSQWLNETVNGPSYGRTDGNTMWEFEFPQVALGDYRDFNVDFPSIWWEYTLEIGFNIEFYDADTNKTDSFTNIQNMSERLDPTTWDDLILGAFPPANQNLDAIWTYIFSAMIVPLGFILYLLLWMMRRKTE